LVRSDGTDGSAVQASAVTLDDSGNMSGVGTLGVGAITTTGLLTTNGQIKFPATQSPSSDANTLDDYEEGTWTPGLTFGGGSTGMSFSLQTGTYTKVGRLVCASFGFILSAKGSSTGALILEVETTATTIALRQTSATSTTRLTNTHFGATGSIVASVLYEVP